MPAPAPSENFGLVLTDVTRLIRAEVDRRIGEAGLGLTSGDGRTLVHVARAGEARQAILAERMGIEAMTLSASLDRLAARGLIERAPDPNDRRAKRVSLTVDGTAMLDRILPITAAFRRDVTEGIPVDDWEVFVATLTRLRMRLATMRDESRRAGAA
ncbi:MAG: MarR family winged helix-turn-helix transcriptional regulator [Rhizobiaceae bacterium]